MQINFNHIKNSLAILCTQAKRSKRRLLAQYKRTWQWIKKRFLQITKEIFTDYGFEYFRKRYYLILPHMCIRVEFVKFPYDDGKRLAYDITIKDLYKKPMETLPEIAEAFQDNSELPAQMPSPQQIEIKINKKRKAKDFNPEVIDEDTWKEELPKKLHYIFDRFKKDDIAGLKYFLIKAPEEDRIYCVNKKVQDYLSIDLDSIPDERKSFLARIFARRK